MFVCSPLGLVEEKAVSILLIELDRTLIPPVLVSLQLVTSG